MSSFTGQLTGGVFDPTGPQYGDLAAKNEKQRQAKIKQGLQSIDAVFGGGNTSFYSPANTQTGSKFDPAHQYYRLTGTGFNEFHMPGADKTDRSFLGNLMHTPGDEGPILTDLGHALSTIFGSEPSPMEQATKLFKRGQLLDKTDASYKGFQPEFFDKRAQDYLNFALPEESRQYKTTADALTYDLGDRGLSESSVAKKAYGDLNRTEGQARQTLVDSAIGQANQLQREVQQARENAIAQLYQTGDPNQAAHSAITSYASLSQPSVFQPLSQMFGGIAQQYYTNKLLNSYQPNGAGSMANNGGASPYYNLSDALGL